MKPFDIKAAKAGKPVTTRGGMHSVEILKYDLVSDYPVVAVLTRLDSGKQTVVARTEDGRLRSHTADALSGSDLVMAPTTVTKTMYANIYNASTPKAHGILHTTSESAAAAVIKGPGVAVAVPVEVTFEE